MEKLPEGHGNIVNWPAGRTTNGNGQTDRLVADIQWKND